VGCGHRVAADGGSGWANSILLMGTLQKNYDQMFIKELLEKHWERKRANARTSFCLCVPNILLKKRIKCLKLNLFFRRNQANFMWSAHAFFETLYNKIL